MMLRRATAAALIPGMLGCTTMRPVARPADYVATKHPDILWVTSSSEVVGVVQPRLSGDTIVGTEMGRGDPVAIPLAKVRSVEARQPDGKRTMLLSVGAGLAAGSLVLLLSQTAPGAAGGGVETQVCDAMGGCRAN